MTERDTAARVLAWSFDHIGDCNRYGNCVEHPYFERPTIEELELYPRRMPNGAVSLRYVPADVVTLDGAPEDPPESGYHALRHRANDLRAAVGEAVHQLHRDRPDRVPAILDSAISTYDRGRV